MKQMITYQQEFLLTVEKDILPLLEEDYQEIEYNKNLRSLDPDWETYLTLEEHGKLKIFSCRDNGKLVGYLTVIVGVDLHDKKSKVVAQDILFLSKDYRKGRTGIKLVKFAEDCLREDGYKSFVITTTTEKAGRLMSALGYSKTEERFEKEL